MSKLNPFPLKIISLLLVFCCTATSAVPAQMIEAGQMPWTGPSAPDFSAMTEWGNLERAPQIHRADSGPQILIFEDAHTSVQAQENIYRILQSLLKQGRLDEVWIEGAAGPLSLHALRNAGIDVSGEWGRQMVEEGLLTGAGRFWLEHPKIRGYGLESADLYHEHLESFRKVISAKETSQAVLEQLQAQLRRSAQGVLQPEMISLLGLSIRRTASETHFQPYVRQLLTLAGTMLGIDWKNPQTQLAWPQLVRLAHLHSDTDEKRLRRAAAQAAQAALLFDDRLRSQTQQVLEFLNRPAGSASKSQSSFSWRAWVEESAYALRQQGLGFERFPDLYQAAAEHVFLQEIQAAPLEQEIQALEEQLWKKAAAAGPEAARLAGHCRKLAQLYDALNLRLSAADAARFMEDSGFQEWEDFLPPAELKRFAELSEYARRFYRLAFRRDDVFLESMLGRERSGSARIAVIAGGFHRPGLESELQKKNYSYWVIRPKMNAEFQETLYEERMLGRYGANHLAPVQIVPMRNQQAAVRMLGSEKEYREIWQTGRSIAARTRTIQAVTAKSEMRISRRRFLQSVAASFAVSGFWGTAARAEETFRKNAPQDLLAPENVVEVRITDLRSLLSYGDLKLKQAYLDALIEHTEKGILKGLMVNAQVRVGEDSEGRPTFELSYRRGDSVVKTAIGSLSSMNPFKFLADLLVNVWEAQVGRPTAVRMANALAQVEQRRFEAFYDRQMNKASGLLADLQAIQGQRKVLMEMRAYLQQAVDDAEDKANVRRLTPVEVNRVRRKLEKMDEEIRDKEREIRKNSILLKKNLGMSTRGPEKIIVTDADLDYTPPEWKKSLTKEASQYYATDQRGPYGLPRNRDYAAALGTIDFSVIAYQHLQASRLAEMRPLGLFSFLHRYDPYSGRGTSFGAENAAAEMTIEKSRVAVAELRQAIHADIADLYVQIDAAEIELAALHERIEKRKADFQERLAEPDYSADDLMDYADFLKEDYVSQWTQRAARVKAFYGLYFSGGYNDFYWFGRGVNFSRRSGTSEIPQETAPNTTAPQQEPSLEQRQQVLDEKIKSYNARLAEYQKGPQTQQQNEAFLAERAQLIAENEALKQSRLAAPQPVVRSVPAAPALQTRDDLNRRWQEYQTRRQRLNHSILESQGRPISQQQYLRERQEAQALDALYQSLLEEERRLRPQGFQTAPVQPATTSVRQTYGQPVYPSYSQQGFAPATPLDFIGGLFGFSPAPAPRYYSRSEVRQAFSRRQFLLSAALGGALFPAVLQAQGPAMPLPETLRQNDQQVRGLASPLPLKDEQDREAETGWVLRASGAGEADLRVKTGFYPEGTVLARVRDARLEGEIEEARRKLAAAVLAYEEARKVAATARDRTVMLPLEAEKICHETEVNRLERQREIPHEYKAPMDVWILRSLAPASGRVSAGTALYEYLPMDRIRFTAVIPMLWTDLQSLEVEIDGRKAEILSAAVKEPDLKRREWEILLDVRLEESAQAPQQPLPFMLNYKPLEPLTVFFEPSAWKVEARVSERVRIPVTTPGRNGRLQFFAADNARVHQGARLGQVPDALHYFNSEYDRLSSWEDEAENFLANPGTKARPEFVLAMQQQTALSLPFDMPKEDFELRSPADGLFTGGERLQHQPAVSGTLDASVLTHQVLIGRRPGNASPSVPVYVPKNYSVREGGVLQVILPTGERLSGRVTAVIDEVRDPSRDLSDYQEIVVSVNDPHFILHPGMPVSLAPALPETAALLPALSPSRTQPGWGTAKSFPAVYQFQPGAPLVENAVRQAPAAGAALVDRIILEGGAWERYTLFEAFEKQFARDPAFAQLLTRIAGEAPLDAAGEALVLLAAEEETLLLMNLYRQALGRGEENRAQLIFQSLLPVLENPETAERLVRKSLQDFEFREPLRVFLTEFIFSQPQRSPLAVAFFLESGFLERTPFLSDEELVAHGEALPETARILFRQEYLRRLAVRTASAHSFRASADIIQSRTTPSIEKLAKLREVQRGLLLGLNHWMLSPENREHIGAHLPEALQAAADFNRAASLPQGERLPLPVMPGFFEMLTEPQQVEKIRRIALQKEYRRLGALLIHQKPGTAAEAEILKALIETKEGRLYYGALILDYPQAMKGREAVRFAGRTPAEWLSEDYLELIQREPFERGFDFSAPRDFSSLSESYHSLNFYERTAARGIYQRVLRHFFLTVNKPGQEAFYASLLAAGTIDDYDLSRLAENLKIESQSKRAVLERAVSFEERIRTGAFTAAYLQDLLPRQSFINYIPGPDEETLQALLQRLTPPVSRDTLESLAKPDFFTALWKSSGGQTIRSEQPNPLYAAGREVSENRLKHIQTGEKPWITEEDSVWAFLQNRQTGVVFIIFGVFGALLLLTFGIAAGRAGWAWMSEWARSFRASELPSNTSRPPANIDRTLPPLPGEAGARKRSEVRQGLHPPELDRMDRLVRRLSDVHFWILRLLPEDGTRRVPPGLQPQSWSPQELKQDVLSRLVSFHKLISRMESDYGLALPPENSVQDTPDGSLNDFEFISTAAERWYAQSVRAMNLIERILKVRSQEWAAEDQERLLAFYEIFLEHASLALTVERAASAMDSLQQDQGFYPATTSLVMETLHTVVRFLFGVRRSVQRIQESLRGQNRGFSDDLRLTFLFFSAAAFIFYLVSLTQGAFLVLGTGWLNISAGFIAVYIFYEMLGLPHQSSSLMERWITAGRKIAPGSYSPGKIAAMDRMIQTLHKTKSEKPSRFIKKNIYYSRRATTRWSLLTTIGALTYFAFIPLVFPIPFYETDWVTHAGAGSIPVVMFIFHIFPTLLGGKDPIGYLPRVVHLRRRQAAIQKFYRARAGGEPAGPRARQLDALLRQTLRPLSRPGLEAAPFDTVVFITNEAEGSGLRRLESFIKQLQQIWPQVYFQIQKQNHPNYRGRAWGFLEARRALYRYWPRASRRDQRRVFILAHGSMDELLKPLPIKLLDGTSLERLHLLLLSVLNGYQAAALLARQQDGGDVIINSDVFHLSPMGLQGDVTLQLANIPLRQAEISRPGIAFSPPGSHRRIAAFFQHPDSFHLHNLLQENPGLSAVSDVLNPDEPRLSAFTGTMIFRAPAGSPGGFAEKLLDAFDRAVTEAVKQARPEDLLDLDVVFDLLILLIRFHNEVGARRDKIRYHLGRMAVSGPNHAAAADILKILTDPWLGWGGYLEERLAYTEAYLHGSGRVREIQNQFSRTIYQSLSRFLISYFRISLIDFYELPLTVPAHTWPHDPGLALRFKDLPFIGGHLPDHSDSVFARLGSVSSTRSFFSDPALFPQELVDHALLQRAAYSEVRRVRSARGDARPQEFSSAPAPEAARLLAPRIVLTEGARAARNIVRVGVEAAEVKKILEDIEGAASSVEAGLQTLGGRYQLDAAAVAALKKVLGKPQTAAASQLVFVEAGRYDTKQLFELLEARDAIAFVFQNANRARAFARSARDEARLKQSAYYVVYAPEGQSVFVNTFFQPASKRRNFRVYASPAAPPLESWKQDKTSEFSGRAVLWTVSHHTAQARKIQPAYVPLRFAFSDGAETLDKESRLVALRLLLQSPETAALQGGQTGVIVVEAWLGAWLQRFTQQQLAQQSIRTAA